MSNWNFNLNKSHHSISEDLPDPLGFSKNLPSEVEKLFLLIII